MRYSASINGIHMMEKYKMALERMDCVPPPEIKENEIDIPGKDGAVDLTDFFGRVFYKNRLIRMEFGQINDRRTWPYIYSEILNKFHGRNCKIIFDDDPKYYWIGRVSVDEYKRTLRLGELTITVNAKPYKYEIVSSDEEWLWDPFDFENGIIREYKNIKVSGTLDFVVDGSPMPVVPEILVSTDMQVRFKGKTHTLKVGINKIYDIEILDGQNILTFIGNGIVTIKYRGGSL